MMPVSSASEYEATIKAQAEMAAREASARWGLLWDEMNARPGDWSIQVDRVEKLYVRVVHNGHTIVNVHGERFDKVMDEVLSQLGVEL